MKNKKIEINWDKSTEFDFGMFKGKGKINVDRLFWKKYIEARFAYETMHYDLIDMIKNKRGSKR